MKKLLFVFNHPAPYKVRFLNELSKHYDLTVIFERSANKDRQKDFYFEKENSFKQVKIKGIPFGNENFISNGVVKHLKHNKYDLVIMNGYTTVSEMLAIKYLKKHKINYCFYINGGIIKIKESKIKKAIKTSFISGASFYFSPDLESNKYLIYYGADKNKIINYPYSTIFESEVIKAPISEKNKTELKNELNISFEKVFVSSGQLIKRKNYVELVKSWIKMPANHGLIIFGDGNQRKTIEQIIKEHDLKNVVLMGFKNREETFKYFRCADAFIFPSKEDIYGHVINEAMSQGLPVISSTNVNSAKKLINGKNGMLINNLDDDLNTAIEFVLKNDLGKNAIKTSLDNTIEIMVDTHKKALDEVMK